MYVGSEFSGWLNQRMSQPSVAEDGTEVLETNWRAFWLVPCVVVGVAAVVFLVSVWSEIVPG
jgi:hypothetical protein